MHLAEKGAENPSHLKILRAAHYSLLFSLHRPHFEENIMRTNEQTVSTAWIAFRSQQLHLRTLYPETWWVQPKTQISELFIASSNLPVIAVVVSARGNISTKARNKMLRGDE